MKCKENKRLLNELVKTIENPKEFIYGIMALQKQTAEDVASAAGISPIHFYVTMSQLDSGRSIGPKICIGISKGLDIDPWILYQVVKKHELKCYLNKIANE